MAWTLWTTGCILCYSDKFNSFHGHIFHKLDHLFSSIFSTLYMYNQKFTVFIKMWIITIASSYKSSQSVMYYDVHMYYVCWYIVLIIWINDEPSVDKPCIEYISLAHYVVGTCMQVFIYRLFLLTLRTAFITLCRCPLPNIYIGTSSV